MRRNSPLPVTALAFVLCVAFAVVAGLLVLHGSDDQAKHVTVLGKRIQLTASQSLGHEVFAEHCAACHQLAASHSVGTTGPDLDSIHPSYSEVLNTVENGKLGSVGDMPPNLATGPNLYAVARYVSRVSNPSAYHP
jgi:cytochrome c5